MRSATRAGLTGDAVAGARAGERDADFSAWMNARQGALLRTAYLLTSDHHAAEDIVQATLAKVYMSWDKVLRPERIDAYARRVLINENNSLWRKAFKRREMVRDKVPDDTQIHERYDEGQAAALWRLVQTLPRRQRCVVVLRYYEELGDSETAEILGISVGTVKSQASRALATLRGSAPAGGLTRIEPPEGES
jgi:RNA polymerase sigma-70 factor (sigma-E family)